MLLQFSENPNNDEIMVANTAERHLLDYRAGEMTNADIAAFFAEMFQSAENLQL